MSYTYTEINRSATIYSKFESRENWENLGADLSNNRVDTLYFHYIDYSHKEYPNLHQDLAKAKDLKFIILKGSSFTFEIGNHQDGLRFLLKALQNQENLEHLQIRNYNSSELDIIFEELSALLEKNKSIKKLSFEHETINSPKFKLLCDELSKLERELELELTHYIELSEKNKRLLKEVLEKNPFIRISPNSLQQELKTMPDEEKDLNSNLTFLLLSGGFMVVGITAIVIAFTLLNAATLGTAGIVAASLGTVSILTSIGLFSHSCTKNHDSSLEVDAPSELWNLRSMG